MSAPEQDSTDGRVLRGERNRQRILGALVELVDEGNLIPTAEQVAERAGVGTRTVFRHFADMESLLGELDERVQKEIVPLAREDAPDPKGTVSSRVAAEVAWRCSFFERGAPFLRSAAVMRWRSPTLQQKHARTVRFLRNQLLEHLPELEHAATELVDGLEAVLSFESWDRLRESQKLGKDRTRQAMERSARALTNQL